MAEDTAFPRCEQGSRPPTLAADSPRPKHEDTAEHLVQLPSLPTPVNGLGAHPKRQELPPRHYPVLPPRKLSHRFVRCASR
ncbi:MAG: hypothetical protein M3Y75_13130 [Actinomycetota bacterium]|nr:hypothetical protein [Actinomycetota bacterium]